MKYTDETLMAYADGELDAATRAQIEQAMRSDPAIAERVGQHRALRDDVFAAFAPVAQEPVPPRLQQAASGHAGLPPEITPIDIARAAREAKKKPLATPQRRTWAQLGGLAAAVLIGVMVGRQDNPEADIASRNGGLVAQAGLAEALSTQLAGSTSGDTRIGVTFVSKNGTYCRSFTHKQAAGLACLEGGTWSLPVVAQAGAQSGEYRQAAAEMPPAVLAEIDERIEGATLDAAAERAAAGANWRR